VGDGSKALKRASRAGPLALALIGSIGALAAPARALAQTRDEELARTDRDAFIAEQRVLMWTLMGWAGASIGGGSAMWAGASGDEALRWAGIQSVAWGTVNATIASIALVNLRADARQEKTAMQWRQDRADARRTFTWNAGLDVLYVGVGAALLLFAKDDALRGSGAGILAQGGFLLAFDTTAAFVVGPPPRGEIHGISPF